MSRNARRETRFDRDKDGALGTPLHRIPMPEDGGSWVPGMPGRGRGTSYAAATSRPTDEPMNVAANALAHRLESLKYDGRLNWHRRASVCNGNGGRGFAAGSLQQLPKACGSASTRRQAARGTVYERYNLRRKLAGSAGTAPQPSRAEEDADREEASGTLRPPRRRRRARRAAVHHYFAKRVQSIMETPTARWRAAPARHRRGGSKILTRRTSPRTHLTGAPPPGLLAGSARARAYRRKVRNCSQGRRRTWVTAPDEQGADGHRGYRPSLLRLSSTRGVRAAVNVRLHAKRQRGQRRAQMRSRRRESGASNALDAWG